MQIKFQGCNGGRHKLQVQKQQQLFHDISPQDGHNNTERIELNVCFSILTCFKIVFNA